MFSHSHSRFLTSSGVIVAAALVAVAAPAVQAQFVMMPDSTNNRLVLFDPNNGALVNSSLFSLPVNCGTSGTSACTYVHSMQVGNEIWISEQIGDKVSRWSFAGGSLGAVTSTLDNVRGMEQIGNTIYLCNDGTGNGAPGPSVHKFTTTGVAGGFFLTPSSSGPFGILDHQGGMLVSSDAANDDIHRWTLAGTSAGTFHNSTSLNFAEQMDNDPAGNILVAGFSSNNILRLNANTGAIINNYTASGARGVYQLGNGNILWTSGAGTFVLDPNTGQSTQVYQGGGRFLDDLVIPEPASLALIAVGSLLLRMRRRA